MSDRPAVAVPALASKLAPARRSSCEVPRDALCERIVATEAPRVVMLNAPAGFGKTTVMLQALGQLQRAGVGCAWLTLDRADNDITRFVAVLEAALRAVLPPSPDVAPHADADATALTLLDRVAACDDPFVLFLDDLECLKALAPLGVLRELIEQLPPTARVVAGSRGACELGLGRWRARGQLLEIDAAQLRFTIAETDHFLRERRGLRLSNNDVARLHDRTEGWAAALWLASMALEHRPQPGGFIDTFSGSNEVIVDYLAEDVLGRQPADVRQFLLRTSVLAHLDPALCDRVVGRPGSEDMLRRLQRANLFLMPRDDGAVGYRYHGLFAQFLQGQLARESPGEVPLLHRAACDWFLQQGRPVPAIGHALAADRARALALLETHVPALLAQGRVRLLVRWLQPLHESGALAPHPMLQVAYAWAFSFTRGPRATLGLLPRFQESLAGDGEAHIQLLALHAMCLALTDELEAALPLAQQVAQAMPTNGFVRAVTDITLANLFMMKGRFQDARRFADAVRTRYAADAGSFNFVISEAVEGSADLTHGRLQEAIARLKLTVTTGLQGSRTTNGNAMVCVLLAEGLYEANELDQAERLLNVYVPLIRSVRIPDQLISAHVVLARIFARRGDGDGALQLLAELEHLGHCDGLPRVVASARLERCRLQLLQGDLNSVAVELELCTDTALWHRVSQLSVRANDVETLSVGRARWALRAGLTAEVVEGLREELHAADRTQRLRRALSLRILLSLALHTLGQEAKAMRVLAKAVSFAAGQGYVSAFVDEGPGVAKILWNLRSVPTVLLGTNADRDVNTFLDGLLRVMGHEPAFAPPPQREPAVPMAPSRELLTRKELQVLRLAADGCSNRDIAQRMFVADTTVRTHLRNINAKLASRNRTQAISFAQRFGLIA